jgi:hypothetical protein
LDFTAWFESLKSLAQVFAGFGLVTLLLAYAKHAAERWCWKNFKRRAGRWISELVESQEGHPNELSEVEWRMEVERMLSEAKFSPMQIERLLETAVTVAKGIAIERFLF